jgi:hypothetical protein
MPVLRVRLAIARHLLAVSLPATALITLSACSSSESTTPPVVPASVSINGNDAALLPGATITLSARVLSSTGSAVSGATVSWSSSNAAVATVSGTGTVAALTAGSTTITASSGGASGSTTIQVNAGGLVAGSGGSVVAAGGAVTLSFPSGAVASTLPVTVTPKPDTVRTAHTAGSAYVFGPTGTQFAQPVTMALRYDVASLPAHTDKASLRIARLVNGAWQPLSEGVQIDSATNTVRAQTRSFSTYAVVRDPCLPQDGSAAVISGAIATDDCLFRVAGRRSDYYTFSAPANQMTVLRSSGALDGLFGIKQATTDAATGTVYNSDNIGRELRLVGNGAPLQLFVSGRDSTKLGNYTFTRATAASYACPNTSAGIPFIVLMPGASYSDALNSANSCTATVQFSPLPTAIGKPLLTHSYAVKLDAGKRYTVSATNMPPQSALTVFVNGTVAAQSVALPAGTRTLSFTTTVSTYFVIELSSGGFTNADFTGPWINPPFGYTVSVSP